MTIAQAIPEHFGPVINLSDFMPKFEVSSTPGESPVAGQQSTEQMLEVVKSIFPFPAKEKPDG